MKTQTVYFFTNKSSIGNEGFNLAVTLYPSAYWVKITSDIDYDDSLRPDAIISFLSPTIIPEWLLKRVPDRAFNIHPASPEYPLKPSRLRWRLYQDRTAQDVQATGQPQRGRQNAVSVKRHPKSTHLEVDGERPSSARSKYPVSGRLEVTNQRTRILTR